MYLFLISFICAFVLSFNGFDDIKKDKSTFMFLLVFWTLILWGFLTLIMWWITG